MAAPSRWAAAGTLFVCASLLGGFWLTAFAAACRKSATVEEPTHVVAGWVHLKHGDFRVNPDDPPLWKFTAARPNAGAPLPVEREPRLRDAALADADQWWRWCRAVLYGTREGGGADGVLMRSRAAMLGWGFALGALIGWWAWKLGGPIAAVAAVALYCLDPNFLAHAPLVNGDVALALTMLAAVYFAWRLGRRVTLVRLLLLGLFVAAALAVKVSGAFVAVIVAVLIASRTLVPAAWPLLGGLLRRWWARPVVALTALVIVTAVAVTGLWASYGFRFAPVPGGARLDFRSLVTAAAIQESRVRHVGNRRLATQPVEEPSAIIRVAQLIESRRWLPQAWVYGALHSYQSRLTQPTYLLGKLSRRGWWYYFPVAMAAKTPLATLLAIPLSLAVLVGAWRRARPNSEATVWSITCLVLPPALYLLIAMLSKTHHGLRHVLPVYPMLFIGMGVAAAVTWHRSRVLGRSVLALLALGLAAETALAFPHYIPFFNRLAQLRGGIALLSESNLDWGQDLPLLAKWQRDNPGRKLYLSYYGTADPAHHGVKAIDVREAKLDQRDAWPGEAGAVLAVSATYLQGAWIEPEVRRRYTSLREREPLGVLGGSVYLYDLSPVK